MTTKTRCPRCQAVIPVEADSCPECEQEFCPVCRAPLASADTSCPRCDTEFGIYCSFCDKEVTAETVICPYCGKLLEDEGAAVVSEQAQKLVTTEQDMVAKDEEADTFTGQCPACQIELYIEDGFCPECGEIFCGRCGRTVSDDDDICPHCHTPLSFACPSCQFSLTAGTDICPNCNTLFPAFCSRCHGSLQPGIDQCPHCRHTVTFSHRSTARVIHALYVDMVLVRLVACAHCGKHFNPAEGDCPDCGFRICAGCQISLEEGERFCPRCGLMGGSSQLANCPQCRQPVPAGSDECPHCQQLLCPECQSAVSEANMVCAQCRVEFELVCPDCDTAVTMAAAVCPNCGIDL